MMLTIGLIREGKIPPDSRVPFTPSQCKWVNQQFQDMKIVVQSSPSRCFTDKEYRLAGIEVRENMEDCHLLMGIKEVPPDQLIAGKTYLFFSHTKKQQDYNQHLFRTILEKKITLIDYECLTHDDGQRILGFGFFAGVVGAHNGMMAYGNRTGAFHLDRVYKCRDYRTLIHTYFGMKLPNLKVAVTGSGRVAHGVLEVMNLLGIHEVEPFEFLHKKFSYPVYVDLKGRDLYQRKTDHTYNRENFHEDPEEYECIFSPFTKQADILMNGIYWEKHIPPLFKTDEVKDPEFNIQTIADITNDALGSIPVNLGDATIENPVYGVDKQTLKKTEPYLAGSIDIMSVGNLPNELPRDASRYFGEQLIKFILKDLVSGNSPVIERATMVKDGVLCEEYDYLKEYAGITQKL